MAEIDLIKISELPATSTIGDADELAVVQGGATKKVPYSALKAGAEVTPDTTLSEAGVPADAAAVGAALALKANQAAVTQALAAKADKTEVTDISGDIAELASVVETKADQTALNQKADKTTTDALRQDLTTLNGIVNQKADKTELNTQIGNVTAELATKANTADVNNLLAAKANVASPVFTGRPQAPTAPKGTATLQLATTAFVQNAIDDKQDTLTFDAAPTQGSTNPVTSGGVYAALEDAKEDAETAIGEVREESEEATAEAREIALKAFATQTASGQLITLSDGADDIPAKKLTLNLSPHQSGSGDPSPDNVRPISGYESVTVTRAGKNLAKPYLYEGAIPAGVTFKYNGDGSATLNGTQTGSGNGVPSSAEARSGGFGFLLPAGTYKPSVYGDDLTNVGCQVITTSGSVVSSGEAFTLNTDTELFIRVTTTGGAGITFDNRKIYIQLEAGITATAYEPPDMAIYSVTFPTAAGTAYGGSLTVNDDGSGTLTVDRAIIATDDNAVYHRNNATQYYLVRSAVPDIKTPAAAEASVISDRFMSGYNTSGSVWLNPNGAIRFNTMSEYGSVAEMLAGIGTPQFVYPLATPTTYTLTADQVTTLLGDNTIFMDADGTIDLQYRADTQKYIDSRISALNSNLAYIEDGTTASRAYSVGQYILIGGQLYKVAASIASGATFTVGTNVVATTVGNELTALN